MCHYAYEWETTKILCKKKKLNISGPVPIAAAVFQTLMGLDN